MNAVHTVSSTMRCIQYSSEPIPNAPLRTSATYDRTVPESISTANSAIVPRVLSALNEESPATPANRMLLFRLLIASTILLALGLILPLATYGSDSVSIWSDGAGTKGLIVVPLLVAVASLVHCRQGLRRSVFVSLGAVLAAAGPVAAVAVSIWWETLDRNDWSSGASLSIGTFVLAVTAAVSTIAAEVAHGRCTPATSPGTTQATWMLPTALGLMGLGVFVADSTLSFWDFDSGILILTALFWASVPATMIIRFISRSAGDGLVIAAGLGLSALGAAHLALDDARTLPLVLPLTPLYLIGAASVLLVAVRFVGGTGHPLATSGPSSSASFAPTPNTGWHPDPTGRHELRYHDGRQWTDAVASAGATTNDAYLAAPPTTTPSADVSVAPSAPMLSDAPTAAPTADLSAPPTSTVEFTSPETTSEPSTGPASMTLDEL